MNTTKNKVTTFIIGLILFILAISVAVVAVDTATPRTFEYDPLTPAYQAIYDTKEYEKCLAERDLAQAKLQDVTEGVEISIDLNEMKKKRDMDCLDIMKEEEAMPEVKSEARLWQKKDTGADINALIAHASRISNNDLDFIATLDKENAGTWSTNVKNWNTNGSYDLGICQFNSDYFMHIINDPQFDNAEWQINKCYELYVDWEKREIIKDRFYAYSKREEAKSNFHLS